MWDLNHCIGRSLGLKKLELVVEVEGAGTALCLLVPRAGTVSGLALDVTIACYVDGSYIGASSVNSCSLCRLCFQIGGIPSL